MARTDTLPHFLTDVADAIRTKKGSSDTIQASDFDTEIENLPSGGGADLNEYFTTEITSNTTLPITDAFLKKIPDVVVDDNVTTLAWAFQDMDFHGYPAPKVVCNNNVNDIEGLFYGAANVVSIDFSGIDSSNCTNFYSLCYINTAENKLTSINFGSNFNTRKVTNMRGMFYSRAGLTSLDLSMFETPVLVNTREMFAYCRQLTFIDMRNFTFDNITESSNMFGSSSTSGVPNGCEIIVKDDTQKTWITSRFSRLDNVKTVAEYEAEQSE